MKWNRRTQGGWFRRRLLDLVKVAAFLPLVAAGAAANDARSSSDHWNAIIAYDDAINAYWAKRSEIRNADISAEEEERMRADLGPSPDAAPAIAAATAIIESNEDRLLDAVDFLLNRTHPPEESQQLAWGAAAAYFGPDWSLVRDYVESQAAILGVAARAYESDELAHLRQGVKLPTWHAVAAARAMIQANHQRSLEAAEFLIEQTYAMERGDIAQIGRWWLGPNIEFGEAALAELIGPDWHVVQGYVDELKAWQASEQAIGAADVDEEEKTRRLRELGEAPKPYRAEAAALAIIDMDGAHEKTREAAEFLLDSPTPGAITRKFQGAQALAAYFPDYDQWPLRLMEVDKLSKYEAARSFIADLVEVHKDPAHPGGRAVFRGRSPDPVRERSAHRRRPAQCSARKGGKTRVGSERGDRERDVCIVEGSGPERCPDDVRGRRGGTLLQPLLDAGW